VSREKSPVHLTLSIEASEQADQDRLDQLTRQLRNEIMEMDVESVELERGRVAPQGAKSVELIAIGRLLIDVVPGVLPSLIAFLKSWTSRDTDRKVKIKAQFGDRSLEVEYSPKDVSQDELALFADKLMSSL